jgi:hypothetical protein
MTPEQPGGRPGDANQPLDLPDAERAAIPPADRRGFTVQPGGHAMAGSAERIGGAFGAAHRGLELVRPGSTSGTDEKTARKVFEQEVSEVRREAARDLAGFGELLGENLQQFRAHLRNAVSGTRLRKLAREHPLETASAIAGFCLAVGIAFRRRSSH